MTRRIVRFFALLMCCSMLLSAVPGVARAEEEPQAQDIGATKLVKGSEGIQYTNMLFDKRTDQYLTLGGGCWLNLEYEDGMGGVYVLFDEEYESFLLTDNDTGEECRVETNGMIHVFADLGEYFENVPRNLKITFDRGRVRLSEIHVFTQGEMPDWVERWEPPADGEADMVLFSTHADDEQIFFAGILPYYAGELEYKVQVVYFTNHRNQTYARQHELLRGLWAVGVRNYPVLGPFPDIKTGTLGNAYANHINAGSSREDLVGYVVEALRRFKPYVAVGHDVDGEYGHGVHMLYADMLMKAAEVAGDPEEYPALAEKYGVWDVPKTYLHLYPENPIVMDWDQPLGRFEGKTAYEVTRDLGFPCHKSQVYDFKWYFAGADTAAQVKKYSPCQFGLFRSTVGEDVQKNDFFENIDLESRQAILTGGVLEEEPEETTLPPETEPEETEVLTQPEETQSAPAEPVFTGSDDGGWILYPAIGASVILLLAAVVERLKK